MTDDLVASITELLATCSYGQKQRIFSQLRREILIHEFENVIGAPAEMILEAVHRAPELTRRMLRGVIADAAFRQFVIPPLLDKGWKDSTPEGNFAYDYILSDATGPVSIQVKLQRSERGKPVIRAGKKYGFTDEVFIVETKRREPAMMQTNRRLDLIDTASLTSLQYQCSPTPSTGTDTCFLCRDGCFLVRINQS